MRFLILLLASISILSFSSVQLTAQSSKGKSKKEWKKIEKEKKKAKKKRKKERKKRKRERKAEKKKNYNKNTRNKTKSKKNYKKAKDSITRTGIPQRDALIDDAINQLGTPYKLGGESPHAGFDCSGLIQYICQKQSINVPRTAHLQSKEGRKIKWQKAQVGDLLFFANKGKKISHVGLVISNDSQGLKMIHSGSSTGVTITNINESDYWKKRIQFARNLFAN